MRRWPLSVWTTSGCHCTPYRRRAGSSKAAIGAPAVDAVQTKPAGNSTAASRCDIHTDLARGQAGQQFRAGIEVGLGPAELARGGVAHRPAQGLRHRLQPVANAEDRHTGGEQRGVRLGRPGGVDALGTARQHQGAGPASDELGHRSGVGDDLAVNPGLAHPPGNELGVLRSVIDHQHRARPVGAHPDSVHGRNLWPGPAGATANRSFPRRCRP